MWKVLQASWLEAHLARFLNASKCQYCGKDFNGEWASRGLRRHEKSCTNKTTLKQIATKLTCNLDCDWIGNSQQALRAHKHKNHLTLQCTRSHSNKRKCGQFLKSAEMEAHLAQYLSENRCKRCGQVFGGNWAKRNLRRHEARWCPNKTKWEQNSTQS